MSHHISLSTVHLFTSLVPSFFVGWSEIYFEVLKFLKSLSNPVSLFLSLYSFSFSFPFASVVAFLSHLLMSRWHPICFFRKICPIGSIRAIYPICFFRGVRPICFCYVDYHMCLFCFLYECSTTGKPTRSFATERVSLDSV